MNVTKELVDSLCAIADEAGRAIMEVYQSGFSSVEKADQSPLTLADLRADAVIRARLEQEFPGMYILSEESCSGGSHDSCAPFFLVDPLDGTKEFLKRNGEFTVNIALVVQGRAVAGVVYAPALEKMYYAGERHGAWRRSAEGTVQLQVTPWDGQAVLRIIGSRSHGGDELAEWMHALPCDCALVTAGSSLKFCLVAEGHADVYPRLAPTSQWDTAAAQCVLEQAGGFVKSVHGHPLSYGLAQEILNSSFVAYGNGIPSEFLPIKRKYSVVSSA